MFIVTVEFEIRPGHVAAFREEMLLQASNSLGREPACQHFDVCFDPQRSERCFLYEKYDDQAAFDEHLASEHFKEFDANVGPWIITKVVQTWEQERLPPEINPGERR